MSESELLAGERELLGIYMTGHPLSQYASLLERYQLTSVQKVKSLEAGSITRLGGLIATLIPRLTKKKEPMAILKLEDLDGSIEVVVYPEAYREYKHILVQDQAIMLCGEVRFEDDVPRMIAQEIYLLRECPILFVERVRIHFPTGRLSCEPEIMTRVREILNSHPGRTDVHICLEFPSGEKVFLDTDIQYKVTCDESLIKALENTLGRILSMWW